MSKNEEGMKRGFPWYMLAFTLATGCHQDDIKRTDMASPPPDMLVEAPPASVPILVTPEEPTVELGLDVLSMRGARKFPLKGGDTTSNTKIAAVTSVRLPAHVCVGYASVHNQKGKWGVAKCDWVNPEAPLEVQIQLLQQSGRDHLFVYASADRLGEVSPWVYQDAKDTEPDVDWGKQPVNPAQLRPGYHRPKPGLAGLRHLGPGGRRYRTHFQHLGPDKVASLWFCFDHEGKNSPKAEASANSCQHVGYEDLNDE